MLLLIKYFEFTHIIFQLDYNFSIKKKKKCLGELEASSVKLNSKFILLYLEQLINNYSQNRYTIRPDSYKNTISYFIIF